MPRQVRIEQGDWRQRAIGRAARRRTVMPVTWIAPILEMGDPKRAGKLIRNDPDARWGPEWRRAKRLLGELGQEAKNVG